MQNLCKTRSTFKIATFSIYMNFSILEQLNKHDLINLLKIFVRDSGSVL